MTSLKSYKAGFQPEQLIGRLAHFGYALPSVVSCFAPADAVWKPDTVTWSVLEVVCHLADEEAEDFPVRVFSSLEDPSKEWPGIDPEGWAISRRYQHSDLESELARFTELRVGNIEKLRAMQIPDWSSTMKHPSFGDMVASDLLAAWCAHDALHLRQLAKRLHQLADRDAGVHSTTRYAGTW